MAISIKLLWTLVSLSVIVGGIALATWGIPAPTTEVTVAIPTEKFQSK